ncbi:MAG: hypothetical protein C4534_05220 [Gaiellales bacterium]|nr:MAG: hypothetical protein C4534_05220 [Gaiellales bacterium]
MTVRATRSLALAAAIIVAAALAACGGEKEEATGPVATGGAAQVEMKDISYAPEDVTVKAGQKVLWVNNDPVGHTVTDESGRFDSGVIGGGGETFEQVYDEPGTYAYHCTIHPTMKGTVIVEE